MYVAGSYNAWLRWQPQGFWSAVLLTAAVVVEPRGGGFIRGPREVRRPKSFRFHGCMRLPERRDPHLRKTRFLDSSRTCFPAALVALERRDFRGKGEFRPRTRLARVDLFGWLPFAMRYLAGGLSRLGRRANTPRPIRATAVIGYHAALMINIPCLRLLSW